MEGDAVPDARDRDRDIRRLAAFRDEIQFESQMLSGRLGAYLSSQSFLVIAYASTMNAGWAQPGVFVLLVSLPLALLGFVLSLDALRSIRTSYGVIQRWHDRQNALLEGHGHLADYWPTDHAGDQPPRDPTLERRFREGTLFAIRSPWIFGVAWIYLAGVAVWLYLR